MAQPWIAAAGVESENGPPLGSGEIVDQASAPAGNHTAFVIGSIFALLPVAGVAAIGPAVWHQYATPQRAIDARWPAKAPEAAEKMESKMRAWVPSPTAV
jgi:hypothetical protein